MSKNVLAEPAPSPAANGAPSTANGEGVGHAQVKPKSIVGRAALIMATLACAMTLAGVLILKFAAPASARSVGSGRAGMPPWWAEGTASLGVFVSFVTMLVGLIALLERDRRRLHALLAVLVSIVGPLAMLVAVESGWVRM